MGYNRIDILLWTPEAQREVQIGVFFADTLHYLWISSGEYSLYFGYSLLRSQALSHNTTK